MRSGKALLRVRRNEPGLESDRVGQSGADDSRDRESPDPGP